MKILPVEAGLFHAEGKPEGETHASELTSAFRNIENPTKNKRKHEKHIFMNRNAS
jgi:hypothetical protein